MFRLVDAEAMGLESEPFTPPVGSDVKLRERLRGYNATAAEIKLLVETKRRVEIDAMDPGQLINLIERKLTEHGITKIIPTEDAMAAHYRAAAMEIRVERAMTPFREELEDRIAAFREELIADPALNVGVPILGERVRRGLEGRPDLNWKEMVKKIAVDDEGADDEDEVDDALTTPISTPPRSPSSGA